MILDLVEELERFGIEADHVLHIGAHEGQEDKTYQSIGATPIYVEANPEVYERLTANLPERECHQVAISDHEGMAEFYVTSMDQSSSLLKLNKHAEIYPSIVETKAVKVRCTTVDQLLAGREETINVLNMDIQGAELLALRGAKTLLPQLDCIMTEVNRDELYTDCAQMSELDEYLGGFGFYRVAESFKYHKTWGDAFYVKERFVERAGWKMRWRHFWQARKHASRAA